MATTLQASGVQTASGTSSNITLSHVQQVKAGHFTLAVTAAATDAGDTLDVYIQSSSDGGTNFDDFIHFTQVLGNGGAKKFAAQWSGIISPTSALHVHQDAALSAGVNQGPVGDIWRVKWVIVDAGSVNVSFTFSVKFSPTR